MAEGVIKTCFSLSRLDPFPKSFGVIEIMKRTKFIVLTAALAAALTAAGEVRQTVPTNSLGIALIRIEPGIFRMGAAGTRDTWEEQPVHEVTISQPFFISETEVTVEQFRQFKPDLPGRRPLLYMPRV